MFIFFFQENQTKIKVTTSALIAAKKKEYLETNMKDLKMYDHVHDNFKNVSCSKLSRPIEFNIKFKLNCLPILYEGTCI